MTLAERLRVALDAAHADGPVLLAGDHFEFDPAIAGNPAAVLIAVTDRAAPGVILTQRTETLRRHPGQVAFPGGRIDPEDDGPIGAALREAEEEIALPASAVEVIGTADRYRTVTGYEVTPVVGVVPPDLALVPAEAEVAAVFEVPLAFLLDSANHVEATALYQGRERRYYEIVWGERRIWGATAAMLVNLSRRLRWTA
ncbi:8-oxo-dGTP pyrophosphatase MutT (NUDIX family) [Sphingomonas naasensis]|uniref:CoA pyrophosphatase n=1 Tax=Sphingomonas naasensis TaxID=1344951 RepID=A0A4V6RB60_9SPHN|nr:CoA pyrophosphatase [Sphingomonas naasensis]NIJ18994.1 8-oxo-dGTP pyrophosphatase MutT (NUDIX family) [Sphingomonas naasensis]TGX46202.1 CoA pyrophosphatase [Sphingomonas naasensis]